MFGASDCFRLRAVSARASACLCFSNSPTLFFSTTINVTDWISLFSLSFGWKTASTIVDLHINARNYLLCKLKSFKITQSLLLAPKREISGKLRTS